MKAQRCFINALGVVNALGQGASAVRAKLLEGDTSGMVLEDGLLASGPARVGRVDAELAPLPEGNAKFECRNNRLLMLALEEIRAPVAAAIARVGPQRFGVVIGTSTTGIL
jgi:3-oxoacyl-[acyl-carrier-protein] synthase-1